VGYDADVREILPQVSVPTLVLHRRDDANFRVGHGRYLAEQLPNVKYVELPGADCLFWVADTEEMLEEIAVFLTGTRHGPEPDRVLATVLFTDFVGSTQQLAELGDRRWAALLDQHDYMVEHTLDRYRGRLVKTTGDGILAIFDAPALAIRCAIALRDELQGLGIRIRAGIHTGEIERRADDVGGLGVHIAARVQSLAAPGQLLVSRTVTDLVIGSGLTFEEHGEHQLKGIPGTWHLFTVVG